MGAAAVQSISVLELFGLDQAGKAVELIDVRPREMFERLRAEFARSVPLEGLDPHACMAARELPADAALYVICQAGARSVEACEKFLAAGFANVVNVEGGTKAWSKAKLPVIRGARVATIMEQVQITAGSLVLIGIGLSLAVHPGFLALSAFVGAGLVFAGATGTCAMGMLLSKMPWNRKPKATT